MTTGQNLPLVGGLQDKCTREHTSESDLSTWKVTQKSFQVFPLISLWQSTVSHHQSLKVLTNLNETSLTYLSFPFCYLTGDEESTQSKKEKKKSVRVGTNSISRDYLPHGPWLAHWSCGTHRCHVVGTDEKTGHNSQSIWYFMKAIVSFLHVTYGSYEGSIKQNVLISH